MSPTILKSKRHEARTIASKPVSIHRYVAAALGVVSRTAQRPAEDAGSDVAYEIERPPCRKEGRWLQGTVTGIVRADPDVTHYLIDHNEVSERDEGYADSAPWRALEAGSPGPLKVASRCVDEIEIRDDAQHERADRDRTNHLYPAQDRREGGDLFFLSCEAPGCDTFEQLQRHDVEGDRDPHNDRRRGASCPAG